MNEKTVIVANDVSSRVRAIIVEHLGVEPQRVEDPAVRLSPESGLAKLMGSGPPNLEADSLDVVELVMAFEEEFGIEITDDEQLVLTGGTVGDCIALVKAKSA